MDAFVETPAPAPTALEALSASGATTNLHSGTPFLGAWSFTPTLDGRLLIRPPQGGALIARFPVDGWIADARPVAGQVPPGAVFVR